MPSAFKHIACPTLVIRIETAQNTVLIVTYIKNILNIILLFVFSNALLLKYYLE